MLLFIFFLDKLKFKKKMEKRKRPTFQKRFQINLIRIQFLLNSILQPTSHSLQFWTCSIPLESIQKKKKCKFFNSSSYYIFVHIFFFPTKYESIKTINEVVNWLSSMKSEKCTSNHFFRIAQTRICESWYSSLLVVCFLSGFSWYL